MYFFFCFLHFLPSIVQKGQGWGGRATFARTAEVPAQITETESPRSSGERKRDLLGYVPSATRALNHEGRRLAQPTPRKITLLPTTCNALDLAFPGARARERETKTREGKKFQRKKSILLSLSVRVNRRERNYASTLRIICFRRYFLTYRARESITIYTSVENIYTVRDSCRYIERNNSE